MSCTAACGRIAFDRLPDDAVPNAGCGPGSCAEPAWRWDRTLGGGGSDGGNAVAFDGAGNVVVTGSFEGTVDFGGGARTSAGAADAFVAAYGPDRRWRWDRTLGGTGGDSGSGVAIDSAGNVVMTGTFWDGADFGGGTRTSAGVSDIFVASYGPDGSWRWDRTVGGVLQDLSPSVTVDGAGNAVVTGAFGDMVDLGGGARTSAGGYDTFVASYRPDGSWRWDRTFGAGGNDVPQGVAVDSAGNVTVTGSFDGTVDFGGGDRTSAPSAGFVAGYGPDGIWRWDRSFAGASAVGHGVAVDAGNTVVTGGFQDSVDLGGGVRTSAGSGDAFVASYGPDGTWQWDRTFGGSSNDLGWSVALDGAGNAIVTGHFANTMDLGGGPRTAAGGTDVFVASYGPDGSWHWDRTFGASWSDVGVSVMVDGSSAVVTGLFGGTVNLGGGPRTSAGTVDVFVLQLGCTCP